MSLSGEEQSVGRPRLSPIVAAIIVVVSMAAAGGLLGVLWAWLAPSIHRVIALARSGQKVHAYLGDEADNLFVSAAILSGLTVVLAVIAAVLLWQWRAYRGPVMATALWVGAGLSAASAAGVGALIVRWHYGSVDFDTAPVSPEHKVHYFTEAPPVFFGDGPLQIATTLLLPAALAALTYALMTVATPRDDLGAWPPQEYPQAVPVTVPS